MDCVACQESVSARLDGEEARFSDDLTLEHLSVCCSCQRFSGVCRQLQRTLRGRYADPVPDLSSVVLAACPGQLTYSPADRAVGVQRPDPPIGLELGGSLDREFSPVAGN